MILNTTKLSPNKIEIDLAFPQTSIPLEAQKEIDFLGNLSVPKSIKPFALRYFSDEEKQHLLSINVGKL